MGRAPNEGPPPKLGQIDTVAAAGCNPTTPQAGDRQRPTTGSMPRATRSGLFRLAYQRFVLQWVGDEQDHEPTPVSGLQAACAGGRAAENLPFL